MNWWKKIIWLSAILLVLAGGIGGFRWYWRGISMDHEVKDLVYEIAGYPETSFEKWLKSMKLDILVGKKPKHREYEIINRELLAKGEAATHGLVLLLDDDNEIVRIYSVICLGKIGGPSVVEALEKAGKSNAKFDSIFREAIGRVKLSGPGKRACDLVYEAAGYPDTASDKYIRENLVDFETYQRLQRKNNDKPNEDIEEELKRLGNTATPGLAYALTDDNTFVRERAARFIGNVGGPGAVEPLIVALLKERNDEALIQMAETLGKLGDKKAVMPLIEVLGKNNSGRARSAAAMSLGYLEDARAVDALTFAVFNDPDDWTSDVAINSLCKIGELSTIKLLRRAKGFPGCYVGEEAFDVAIDKMLSRSLFSRFSIASRLGDKKEISSLIDILTTDKDDDLRILAAYGLFKLQANQAIGPLGIAAKTDSSVDVRASAVDVLCKFRDPKTIDVLMDVLQNERCDLIRLTAAWRIIASYSDKAIIPFIHALQTDQSPEVRVAAAQYLGRSGGRKADVYLRVAMQNDASDEVRAEAARQIYLEDIEPLIHALKNDRCSEVRAAAAHQLGHYRDKKAVEPLMSALKCDKVLKVRRNAAEALGYVGDFQTIEVLRDILQKDKDRWIQYECMNAIEMIRKTASQPSASHPG